LAKQTRFCVEIEVEGIVGFYIRRESAYRLRGTPRDVILA
jgi:hypothetical protein